MRNGWAFGVAAVVLAHAPSAWADDGLRLVELVAPRTFDRGSHDLTFPAPVAASTHYFLTVERSGAVGHVELNGQVVVRPDDLVGPGGELLRVGVPLGATNGLKVKVSGPRSLTLSIQGIVPASALPSGAGKRVAHFTLYSAALTGDRPARGHTAAVSVPTTSGLFSLRVEQTGPAPANTAGVQWNGVSVLGVVPLSPARNSADGPVVVRESNVLETSVLGPQGSRVTVTLSGWIVDETAPTVSWDEVPTELEPTTPLRATFSDATSGIAPAGVKILLDESQDVTAAFTVGTSEATSTIAALEALAPATVFGIHTLTAIVTDRAGLAAQASLRVVRDTPPVLTTPGDLTVEQTSPAGSVVSFTVTAVDDLDPSPVVECAPPSGSVFAAGTTTVTCTARDSAGNVSTATFGVTVRDTTPPALGTPPDLIVEQASPAGAVVTYTVAATDAVDSAPIVECAPASGDVFPAGTTAVTCTARDAAGNVSSTTFSVTVRDSTPPTLVPSVDLVVEQTSPAGAVVAYTVRASDAGDAGPVVECTPASGSVFAAGATTVTCTARDAAGNISAATFTVTVRDTTPPVLETPGDLIVEQASPAGAVAVYSVTASDAVDAAPALECTPASGDVFAAGTTTVTCTARDTAGNVSTDTFTVTVRDTTPPVLETPGDLIVEQASPAGAVVVYSVTASDTVDAAPALECTPASGDMFAAGTTTVTCTARDTAGNVGTATFTVTVRDTTPPVLVAPDDQIVEQTSPAGAIVTFTATASDAVDPSPVVECMPASGTTFAACPPPRNNGRSDVVIA